MKKNNDRIEPIRYLFESEPNRKWRLAEIGDILGYRGGRTKLLRSLLSDLVQQGVITTASRGTFIAAKNSSDIITGRLEVVRSGIGFVNDTDHGRSIRIAAVDVAKAGALPGDHVRVRPLHIGSDSESGRIIEILPRGEKIICGTLSVSGRHCFVTPVNPIYQNDIRVPNPANAHDGDRVVVRFTNWTSGNKNPEGEIIDVIGPADKPSLDTSVVCREFELPGPFSDDVIQEATEVSSLLENPGERLDLRKTYILTIDPASSRDFDDAISFARHRDGSRELGIHIADVSHFVRPGSALDKEAAIRGNSVYLADKVIPMLPEQLSNGICSLRPREDRLAFSVFLTFDKAGNVLKRSFAKSIINSSLRLNYEQALAIIEDRPPEGLKRVPKAAIKLLQGASALALELRAARMKKGALDLDVPECRVIIDANGIMTDFVIDEYDISHQMIEECMVAANEAVAAELASHGQSVIARLHEPPDPAKIADLTIALQTLGFHPGNISSPTNLSAFIASIENHPLRTQAHTQILRSMKRALYSADSTGHFGLAKHFYSHFTSPIRRYTDLVLHRQLCDFLAHRKSNSFSRDYLKHVAAVCTETEQRADEAERTLLEIKKYRFLQQQIDRGNPVTYDAVVAKVTSFGLFVDLPLLMVGGLIHISTISDQYVRFNPSDESLSVNGLHFALGDSLKVFIAHVDFNARRLDFALSSPTGKENASSHPASSLKKHPFKKGKKNS